jgi:aspartate/methionine/tyrosine aminotransferase
VVRYQASRDRLSNALSAAGYAILHSEGTYFLNIDLAASGFDHDDAAFCRCIIAEAGVAAIPLSAFYASKPATRLVRLCFAKQDQTLDEAAERLARFRGKR